MIKSSVIPVAAEIQQVNPNVDKQSSLLQEI